MFRFNGRERVFFGEEISLRSLAIAQDPFAILSFTKIIFRTKFFKLNRNCHRLNMRWYIICQNLTIHDSNCEHTLTTAIMTVNAFCFFGRSHNTICVYICKGRSCNTIIYHMFIYKTVPLFGAEV